MPFLKNVVSEFVNKTRVLYAVVDYKPMEKLFQGPKYKLHRLKWVYDRTEMYPLDDFKGKHYRTIKIYKLVYDTDYDSKFQYISNDGDHIFYCDNIYFDRLYLYVHVHSTFDFDDGDDDDVNYVWNQYCHNGSQEDFREYIHSSAKFMFHI